MISINNLISVIRIIKINLKIINTLIYKPICLKSYPLTLYKNIYLFRTSIKKHRPAWYDKDHYLKFLIKLSRRCYIIQKYRHLAQ